MQQINIPRRNRVLGPAMRRWFREEFRNGTERGSYIIKGEGQNTNTWLSDNVTGLSPSETFSGQRSPWGYDNRTHMCRETRIAIMYILVFRSEIYRFKFTYFLSLRYLWQNKKHDRGSNWNAFPLRIPFLKPDAALENKIYLSWERSNKKYILESKTALLISG